MAAAGTPELGVIIVTYNVRTLAHDALTSLYADLAVSGLRARVVVVDSASNDGTASALSAAFPQADVIASPENLGFARANNLGLKRLGFGTDAPLPDAVYFLNPDTISQPGAVRALYDALFSADGIGMTGARLRYGDGTFQHSAFAFPGLRQLWAEFFPTPGRWIEGRFNGRYPRSLYASGQPFPVDFVLGAAFMVRRAVIEQTGGFDENFFMYCEEVDWAWRARAAGWSAWCVPAADVIHLGGQSSGQDAPRTIVNLWSSRLRLYDRWYPPWKRRLARRLAAAGLRRRRAQADSPALIAAYDQMIAAARS